MVSGAANARYLAALAAGHDPAAGYARLQPLCGRVEANGRRYRALNPLSRRDSESFAAVLRGEHLVRGFRAAEVAAALGWPEGGDEAGRKRRSARLNRRLRLLRAHGWIARIPRTRRYRVTVSGYTCMSATLHLHRQPMVSTPRDGSMTIFPHLLLCARCHGERV